MSNKVYQIAFNLGAKMNSSLRTAFASTNRNISQTANQVNNLNNRTGTLTQSTNRLSNTFSNFGNVAVRTTGRIASGVASGIIAPFNSAIGIVKNFAGTLGILGTGALVNLGLNRLSAIENAEVSLRVMMGDEDTAKAFLDDVLAFARTTPFAFPELAESARNLVAFGMDAEKVVPTLKAIGDAAAASGKGTAGLTQIADAFGAMQVSGTLSMGEVNRLASAGVPALKILANEAGIAADEMKKKISSGSIDAVKAIDVLVKGMQEGTNGIAGPTAAMAGIMEEMKSTWTGSVDSLKSSFSSTMAKIMEPIKPRLQDAMKWTGDTFSKLPELINTIATKTQPFRETMTKIFQEVMPHIKDFYGITKEFIGKAVQEFEKRKPMFESYFEGLKKAFNTFWPIIKDVASVFIDFTKKMFNTATPIWQYFSEKIVPNVIDYFNFIKDSVVPALGKVFQDWFPKIQKVVMGLADVFRVVWSILKPIFDDIFAAFNFVFPIIKDIVMGAISSIGTIVSGLFRIFGGIIDFVVGVFSGDWKRAWEGVKEIFGGVFETLAGIMKVPMNAVIALINTAIRSLNKISFDVPDWVPEWAGGGKTFGIDIPEIPMLAKGGITTGPTLAMIGEGAEQEAVLPLSKLKTLLGMSSESNNASRAGDGQPIQIFFNPSYVIQGNADENVLTKVATQSFEEFKRMMKRYESENVRLSFKPK